MYTYAFLKSDTAKAVTLPKGIFGTLTLVYGETIAAVVEVDFSVSQFEALKTNDQSLIQAVLAHDALLCDLSTRTTLLPLRFGTLFSSHTALAQHLREQSQRYQRVLSQLENCSEYMLKAIPNPEPSPADFTSETKGRQYFLAKKRQYQAQQSYREEQAQQWQAICNQVKIHYPDVVVNAGDDATQRLYLLVVRDHVPVMLQHLADWQAVAQHWQLQISEALPPYHFVT